MKTIIILLLFSMSVFALEPKTIEYEAEEIEYTIEDINKINATNFEKYSKDISHPEYKIRANAITKLRLMVKKCANNPTPNVPVGVAQEDLKYEKRFLPYILFHFIDMINDPKSDMETKLNALEIAKFIYILDKVPSARKTANSFKTSEIDELDTMFRNFKKEHLLKQYKVPLNLMEIGYDIN